MARTCRKRKLDAVTRTANMPILSENQALAAKFANLKIVILGDIMLDHYIIGDSTRISPEAPVPVVSVSKDSYVPGGAANVANNLVSLGTPVTLIGSYSEDQESTRLKQVLAERQIQLSHLGQKTEATTIVKTRVVAQRQQVCRIDREAKPAAYALHHLLENQEFISLILNADAVLFSDYAKGVITNELIEGIHKMVAGSSKAPMLVVDPKPRRKLNLSGMSLMTPNRSEALQMAGYDANDDIDDEVVCKAIFKAYNPEKLVITLGADGMLLGEHGKMIGRIPTAAQEVFDVSGAGDTVVAVLTASIASGLPLEKATFLANKAAGIVVSHLGTTPITREELFNA
jgi:rfaE bifunctional protein kinase chain/domain